MKKFIGLTAITLLLSLSVSAQRNNEENKRGVRQGSELTSEQKVALQSKKMALKLDLNENQQKQIHKLMLKSAEERNKFREENRQNRKNGIKPTSEQKFNRENIRLEKQMAHKNEMKKILNEDQYEKWQKTMMIRNKNGDRSKMEVRKGAMNSNNNSPKPQKNKRY